MVSTKMKKLKDRDCCGLDNGICASGQIHLRVNRDFEISVICSSRANGSPDHTWIEVWHSNTQPPKWLLKKYPDWLEEPVRFFGIREVAKFFSFLAKHS